MKILTFFRKGIFSFFVLLSPLSGFAADVQDCKARSEYEGWVWRKSLNFLLPDNTYVDIDTLHRQMSASLKEIQGTSSGISEERNAVFIRLGLIISQDEGEFDYELTECFANYVFLSGIAKSSSTLTPVSSGRFYKVEPQGYSFDIPTIRGKLLKRFSPPPGNSAIGQESYKRQDFDSIIESSFQRAIGTIDSLNEDDKEAFTKGASNAVDDVPRAINYFYDKHTHSEQKLLFFLESTLNSIPLYWRFDIQSCLLDAVTAAEELILNKYRSSIHVSKKGLIEKLQNFEQKFFSQNSPVDWQKERTSLRVFHVEQDLLKESTTKFEVNMKTLLGVLDLFSKTCKEDVLQLGSVQSDLYNLSKVEKQLRDLAQGQYNERKALDASMGQLKLMKSILNLKPEEEWLNGLSKIFPNLWKNKKSIVSLVVHLHSYNDICESCAPSIVRELERDDGFFQRLKSIVISNNQTNHSDLSVHVLASCDVIRSFKIASEQKQQEKRINFKDKFSEKQNYLIPILQNPRSFFQMQVS